MGELGLPPVVSGNAVPADVAGKRVLGVLPLHLASHAMSVTEMQLTPPPRGEELSAAQVAERRPTLRTFVVEEVTGDPRCPGCNATRDEWSSDGEACPECRRKFGD